MLQITWLGHACWLIQSGSHTILIDPFLDNSPTAPLKSGEVSPDFILVTHGHGDHIEDAAKIAKRTGATVITNFEIANWLAAQGVKNTIGMNLGGAVTLPFGRVKMTVAHHSSSMPDGTYGGNPGGFLIELDGRRIYIAGDTALFLAIQLYGTKPLDLAILPIGDLYTMGPEDSIEAIKLLKPKRVAPSHYNTWPPIAQDAAVWAAQVRSQTTALPETPAPGGKFRLD